MYRIFELLYCYCSPKTNITLCVINYTGIKSFKRVQNTHTIITKSVNMHIKYVYRLYETITMMVVELGLHMLSFSLFSKFLESLILKTIE